jgi:hypothetical protein
MANGRNLNKRGDTGRDPGGFVALPWSVLDCSAFSNLSHPARSLLIEFARQLGKDNNGRLLASGTYLRTRGWKSSDVITRAKRELIEAGFIFETVKGQRPNRASWYAVTWYLLAKLVGYDAGATNAFVRSAYQKNTSIKNTNPRPCHGVRKGIVAPSGGVGSSMSTPPNGAVRQSFDHCFTPLHGDHLDMPSICERTQETEQEEYEC